MKICLINSHETRRTVVQELAEQLVKRKNYEVKILQPMRRSTLTVKKTSQQMCKNVEIVYFPSTFLLSGGYVIPSFKEEVGALRKLLIDSKCEIIQSTCYEYLTSIGPILMKKISKTPIVLTTDNLPGYSWFFGDAIIDLIAKLYTYSLGKRILNSYDAVVLLYKRLAEEVNRFGVPHERIHVIPNGIDVQKFMRISNVGELRTKLQIKDDEKVLLFIGRLSMVKRLEVLIQLTKTLLKDGFRIKTIIVGGGPYEQHYKELSRELKNNIIFTGHVTHAQTYKYHLLADIFILPSLSEGLPTVLLEASAAGKPVVTSNVNGIPDIVMHKETGFLVEKSDMYSYTHYVKLLLANEDLSRKMGEKAAEYVKQNFSWDTIVDKYDKMYQELAN